MALLVLVKLAQYWQLLENCLVTFTRRGTGNTVVKAVSVRVLKRNDQTCELQTIIRDRNTSRNDFKFYADRLIRLVIEESLNQLPYSPCTVVTPIGFPYDGLQFEKGNCGVSIVRSGEAMEQGLRDCCRSMRIGKILIDSDHDTHEAKVVYGTGNTIVKAVSVLKDHSVLEENIVLANLFCTPPATQTIVTAFPQMKILTSEIHPVAPNHFGQKYFGTD
ncbi:uracil phosphoribosyltransferase homolog [Daphnia magna]|uniref:uracil phosphoribosyltransferase homolog n=1 Tax=Daphnia magna TaxID=35525 RepID=UPI001E1BD253|nr:uracil phosphoribosyltransferase homolog [Daphnia magna]XP_045024075.1 uracil phosphoribosyltransferase homolog [Daphnia magna]XP_045024079.1 uracil phosphoribosyltransferase homolog [Daphnia magna]